MNVSGNWCVSPFATRVRSRKADARPLSSKYHACSDDEPGDSRHATGTSVQSFAELLATGPLSFNGLVARDPSKGIDRQPFGPAWASQMSDMNRM